ncbi:uncharacterized protein LOC119561821 isoform X2 [Drosophila subpulchrella]|uniref:uncharacterized protein LOC119561821 isoform X2 n=1 Tax=Drosophila subpulchrella TaxID=1486046 RepID=UPI0018A1A6BB|nr:uncharacterized protein LOC119561821 isoform X2 [Drosophila subpulchrella]
MRRPPSPATCQPTQSVLLLALTEPPIIVEDSYGHLEKKEVITPKAKIEGKFMRILRTDGIRESHANEHGIRGSF